MSLTNEAENLLVLLLFQNANWANIGDATGLRGSTAAGSFYISLHTADPGETGDQTTSEATYTSYARVAVARTSGGFSVTADTASNAAAVTFPACTGGSSTCTHFGKGRRPATVNLTDDAIAALRLITPVAGNPYVFASKQRPGRPLSYAHFHRG